MTLTSKCELNRVKLNQHALYVGQWLFLSNCIVQTHVHTHTGPFYLPGSIFYPYRDGLAALNLVTRTSPFSRLRADICLRYKIIFGMCDIDLNNILSLRGDVLTRGHRYKVMQEHCTDNFRYDFFVQRVAPIWDSLPPTD